MKTLTYAEIADHLNAENLDYALGFDVDEYSSVEALYNFANEDEDFDGEFTVENVEHYARLLAELS